MADRRCSGCRFWDRSADAAELGDCRRGPPALSAALLPLKDGDAAEDYYDASRWPVTAADEWCGEWQAAGEAPA